MGLRFNVADFHFTLFGFINNF